MVLSCWLGLNHDKHEDDDLSDYELLRVLSPGDFSEDEAPFSIERVLIKTESDRSLSHHSQICCINVVAMSQQYE